jgi:hypothetical protein
VTDLPAGDKPAGDKPPGEQKPPVTETPAPELPKSDPVVVPEKYELTLPENAPFEQADLDAIAAEARAMSCTQEEAQALVLARVAHMQERAASYLVELKADPELGGAKLDETVQLALKGRSFLAPEGSEEAAYLARELDKTGAGNHRLMMRMFARLGRAMSEDGGGGLRPSSGPEKTAAQKMYPGMNP